MNLPRHLKKRLPKGSTAGKTRALIGDLKLHTVCDEARCPNRVECYAQSTATFLLMGDICTRRCAFCSIDTGRPGPLDPNEPSRVAEAVRRLGLRHAVLTSVDRDDLADGGAVHLATAVRAIHVLSPTTSVEVLTPDFQGSTDSVDTLLEANPLVFNHNVETVERLQRLIRPSARFDRSLAILRHAKTARPDIWTKSGIMVGLGETFEEIRETLRAMRRALVDIVTIGQYLQPTSQQIPVTEYFEPEAFDAIRQDAVGMGFASVMCGPFVRSSHLAEEAIPS